MPYTLKLSDADWDTIHFVGGRYCWSAALLRFPGMPSSRYERLWGNSLCHYVLSESEAWELCVAFEADTEGGHGMLPMLDPQSRLYRELQDFVSGIV